MKKWLAPRRKILGTGLIPAPRIFTLSGGMLAVTTLALGAHGVRLATHGAGAELLRGLLLRHLTDDLHRQPPFGS